MLNPALYLSAVRTVLIRLAIKFMVLMALSSSLSVWAETPSSALGLETNPLWLRYPAISPDGKTIAFNFRGHIFTVPANGRLAIALTAGPAHDSSPVWSPDGKLIAFASDRYGHDDVFVIGSQGGPARRLTTYSTNSAPTSFTPDGQYVLFNENRLGSAKSSMFPER